MIPFFVVDRPMSLNIIKTFFVKHPGVRFGLMTHALVSKGFRELYAEFPCDRSSCWLRKDREPCNSKRICPAGKLLRDSVTRVVDCGIFADGKRPPYPRLFDVYDQMKADYGIMKDFLGDPKRTLRSAREAIRFYGQRDRSFELILVAQGRTPEEYASSCESLAALGVGKLAIGGLLVRKVNSVRYASAGTMESIEEVLAAVRKRFPRRWLFVLGCYHPKRHSLLERHGVLGSDYKGWIFNYEHRLDLLADANQHLWEYETKGRLKTALEKKARKRQALWADVARARRGYATTKNSSEDASQKKAAYRKTLRIQLSQMSDVDGELAHLRHEHAKRDGLPRAYKALVATYRGLVNRTDKEVRVAGVHRYMAAEILPRIAADGRRNGAR
jgi:hypothetical protein